MTLGRTGAALLIAFVTDAVAQSSLNLTVVGTTSTQAILQFTAPNTSACTVEASESPSFWPLVHDLDPALFPQANLDSRKGDLVNGQSRVVVIGKRVSETASDQNTYSRALQANTTHYARITCGATVQTAQFSTATIRAGETFNDGPQVDPDRPGQWKMPTRFEDRAQTIVDPQTGALLHAVSIQAEGGGNFNGIFMLYGGFARMCDPKLVGPAGGPLGFACTMTRYGQGGGVAYWIVPSTGEVRLLGSVPISGGGAFGPLVSTPSGTLRSYGPDNSGNTVWVDYIGNFVTSTELPVSGWNTYASVSANQMVHDFDPAFPLTGYDCGRPWAAAGQYVLVNCGTGQDMPGWLAVLYGGDGRAIVPGCTAGAACPRIVAAADIFNIPSTQYCTLHNVQQMDDVVSINVQVLPSGGPRCVAMGNMVYWRFKTDPHGAALVIDHFFDGGGHWDHGPLGRVTETGSGWGAVVGAPPSAYLDQPYTIGVEDSPFFAGARGLSWGSTTSKHPSYHQIAGVAPPGELGWLLDMLPFDGGQFYSPASGATPISGQLYKYNPSIEQATAVLARKQVPTLAVSGGRALIDISGPGSVIGDTAADSFKYCVALVAGECRPGSAAGDTYVNAPDVWKTYCAGADGPVPDLFDLCIGNMGAYQQAMVQADLTGTARPRVITYGLAGIRNSFFYSTAKSLPDASWALFSWGVVKQGFGNLTNVWMAKLPPLVDDHVDRSTFLPLTVNLTPPANQQIARAIIQFGYAEQGLPGQYYCTSRREACVAASATFTASNPFQYATTESYNGIPCPTSCQIAIPVVPNHTVYYQAIYLDASGRVVTTGQQGVSAELAQANVAAGTPAPNPPPAPAGLTGTSTSTRVNLSWISGGGTTAGFKVYRSGSLIGSVTSPAYADTNLSPSTSYSYAVAAYDANGTPSLISNTVTIATLAPVTVSVSPSAVTLSQSGTQAFTATVGGSGNTAVTWSLGSPAGSISTAGLYTAPSVINATTTVAIIATSVADPTVSGSAVVTLQPPASGTLTSVTLASSSVTGGQTVQGAFALSAAAAAGASSASITCSDPSVTITPASILLTAPSTGGSFSVATHAVATLANLTISVTYNGVTRSAGLTVNPPALASVTPASSTVTGGAAVSLQFGLTGPAATGTSITVGSSNQNAIAATSVAVTAGQSSGTLTIATSVVAASTPVTLSLSSGGATQTVTVTVNPPAPPALASVTPASSTVTGGAAVSLQFSLTGPAPSGTTIAIGSSNQSAIPATSVAVTTGQSTGTLNIATNVVATSTAVTLSLSSGGATQTVTVTVNPPAPPALSSVTPASSTVTGGAAVSLQFSLTGPAPSGTTIAIGTSNQSAIAATSVAVTAGQSSGTLNIATNVVAASTAVTLSLSSGGVTKTVTVTVNPPAPPALSSVTPASSTVTGGAAVSLQFSLTGPAPTGTTIAIASSNQSAIAATSVAVTAGQSSGTLTIATNVVAVSTTVTLSLSSGGVTQTVTVTVNPPAPPALSSVTPASSTVTGGAAVSLQFSLTGPAPTGTTIAIASSNQSAIAATSVAVTAGQSSGALNIATNVVAASTAVTLSLSSGGATQTVTVTVNPPAPPALSSVTPASSTVTGGAAVSLQFSLTGPAPSGTTIAIGSSNQNAIAATSVAVTSGQTSGTLNIATNVVAASTAVTLSLSSGGVTKTVTVTVNPPAPLAQPALSSVTPSSATVTGGSEVLLQFSLTSPAVNAGTLSITTSSQSAVPSPGSVAIAAGQSSGSVSVPTRAVVSAAVVTLSFSYGGVTRTVTVTVNPPALASVTQSSATVTGGTVLSLQYNLTGPATNGSAILIDSSKQAAVPVPSSIPIPFGRTSGTVNIQTNFVWTATPVTITLSLGGVTKTVAVTVVP